MYTRQFQILDLSGYKSADVPHPTHVTVVAMNITVDSFLRVPIHERGLKFV